jgi:hypothetical protein
MCRSFLHVVAPRRNKYAYNAAHNNQHTNEGESRIPRKIYIGLHDHEHVFAAALPAMISPAVPKAAAW